MGQEAWKPGSRPRREEYSLGHMARLCLLGPGEQVCGGACTQEYKAKNEDSRGAMMPSLAPSFLPVPSRGFPHPCPSPGLASVPPHPCLSELFTHAPPFHSSSLLLAPKGSSCSLLSPPRGLHAPLPPLPQVFPQCHLPFTPPTCSVLPSCFPFLDILHRI